MPKRSNVPPPDAALPEETTPEVTGWDASPLEAEVGSAGSPDSTWDDWSAVLDWEFENQGWDILPDAIEEAPMEREVEVTAQPKSNHPHRRLLANDWPPLSQPDSELP